MTSEEMEEAKNILKATYEKEKTPYEKQLERAIAEAQNEKIVKISMRQARSILVSVGFSIKNEVAVDSGTGQQVVLACRVFQSNGVSETFIGEWPKEIYAIREIFKWGNQNDEIDEGL